MQVEVKNKDLFPDAVRELLHALYTVGFFEESMLIGSWVMSLYQEEFGINYALRTRNYSAYFHSQPLRAGEIRRFTAEYHL